VSSRPRATGSSRRKLTALLDQHTLAVESAVLADMGKSPDRDSNAGPTA
jgi:hypothetical protein